MAKQPTAIPTSSQYNREAHFADGATTASQRWLCSNPADTARDQARKLHALLYLIGGEGQKHVEEADDAIREHIFWLAEDLATEVMVLTDLAAKVSRPNSDEVSNG